MIREWYFHKISLLAVIMGIMFTALFGILTASMYQRGTQGLGHIFLIFSAIILLATLRSSFFYIKSKKQKERIFLGEEKIEWYVAPSGGGELRYQDLLSIDLYITYKGKSAILDMVYHLPSDESKTNKHIKIDITRIIHPTLKWWNISSGPLFSEAAFLLKENIINCQHEWKNKHSNFPS